MLVGATRTFAVAKMSLIGTGNRSHAAARSRSRRARSSTARRSYGSRLLSSGFVTCPFPAVYKVEILHQFRFFFRCQMMFCERRHAAVPFILTPFRRLHEVC